MGYIVLNKRRERKDGEKKKETEMSSNKIKNLNAIKANNVCRKLTNARKASGLNYFFFIFCNAQSKVIKDLSEIRVFDKIRFSFGCVKWGHDYNKWGSSRLLDIQRLYQYSCTGKELGDRFMLWVSGQWIDVMVNLVFFLCLSTKVAKMGHIAETLHNYWIRTAL